MRRSDDVYYHQSSCFESVLPGQSCYQDVLKGDIVVGLEERVEEGGYRAAASLRRMMEVERLVMVWEESLDKVGCCCNCYSCESDIGSGVPAHLAWEDLPQMKSCDCGPW